MAKKVYKGRALGGPINREEIVSNLAKIRVNVVSELNVSTNHLLVSVTEGYYSWKRPGEYFLWTYEKSSSFVKGAK